MPGINHHHNPARHSLRPYGRMIRWCVLSAIFFLTAGVLAPATIGGRPLTDSEQHLALPIFASSLDLTRIRIHTGGLLTWIYPGVTIGNHISFPNGFSPHASKKTEALLLHELTHVYQYQQTGWSYLPRAVFEEITQSDAYVVKYEPGKAFSDYDIEEQAEIVAEFFLNPHERFAPLVSGLSSSQAP